MYCGIDVSKGKSNICVLGSDNVIVAEFEIEHTKDGFEKLEKYLTKDMKIGMEVTGNYCKVIYSYLKQKYDVIYVDNVQMKNFARLNSPTIKNDRIDARLIAQFLKFDFKIVTPPEETDLKDLCKLYHKNIRQVTRYKCMFKDQLNIIFPELEKNMCKGFAKIVAHLLLKYPTPQKIAQLSAEEIRIILNENVTFSKKRRTLKYAQKIKDLAANSIGVKDYPEHCFTFTIRHYCFIYR